MGRGNPSEKGILRVIVYCYGEKLHTPCFARERPSICMELEIIRDYIKIISDMAHKIEKEMNV